jgi:predicted aminopeptidase
MVAGCYYLQAAGGHLDLMGKRQPIDALIEDEATDPGLQKRLELLRDARAFSVTELDLPDNGSYSTFSDLDREFVVWNVMAAGEFSIDARTWCFPVAGCVGYRGYFKEKQARKKARELAADGYDVYVGGATAYSTLGRFDDPVLSTMLVRDDTALVALLFHELAHQELYIKDDTSFNESFATAVEELGISRWLTANGEAGRFDSWQRQQRYTADLTRLALAARDDLEQIYASDLDDDAKRREKAERIAELTTALEARAREAGVEPGNWWREPPLNNARLAGWSAYESFVPGFRALFDDCDSNFRCFYDAARAIGALETPERHARLEALADN